MTKSIWFLAAAGCLAIAGCSTTAVNPPAPHPNTGYVDFYTDSPYDLCWEVKRASEPGGEMQTVYCKYKPVPGTVLRLAAPPGTYQFQVWFSNEVTHGPQAVQVQVANGMVTPVHTTLTSAGTATINQKEYGFRPSAKGYGHGTKIVGEEFEVFRIGAAAGTPQAYQPKERMPYFSPEPKQSK